MANRDGVRWHCPDPRCNWTVVATPALAGSTAEPHCICRTTMHRGDALPTFHYLDFLRAETADEKEAGADSSPRTNNCQDRCENGIRRVPQQTNIAFPE